MPRIGKFRDRKWKVIRGYQRWGQAGRGMGTCCLMSFWIRSPECSPLRHGTTLAEFLFGRNEKFYKETAVRVAQHCVFSALIRTLKNGKFYVLFYDNF